MVYLCNLNVDADCLSFDPLSLFCRSDTFLPDDLTLVIAGCTRNFPPFCVDPLAFLDVVHYSLQQHL